MNLKELAELTHYLNEGMRERESRIFKNKRYAS